MPLPAGARRGKEREEACHGKTARGKIYVVDNGSAPTPKAPINIPQHIMPHRNKKGLGKLDINFSYPNRNNNIVLKDYGPDPYVVNIEQATKQNDNFRLALWTGQHLQLTLMSIKPGEDIGLEIHPNTDQFLRIEQGRGIVNMGKSKDMLSFQKTIKDNDAIFVPAGTWHNVVNTGNIPLKLYSIYAPPQHPHGTVQRTKAEAMEE